MRLAMLAVTLALAADPSSAAPFEVGVDARLTSRVVVERNLPSSSLLYDDAAREWVPGSYLALRETRLYPVLAASASVSATFEPWLLAVVTLDPGVLTLAPEHLDTMTRAGLPALSTDTARRWRLDGLAPAEALRQGWGLREAYVELGLGREEAVEVSLGKRRWTVLTLGPIEIALGGALQWGATSFRFPGSQGAGRSRLDLPGLALKADVRWEATSRLELSAFGLWLTGGRATTDDGALASTYPVFVSLVPFLPYCSLFFDGGLAANLATREASLVGVSGRGLLGGGVTAALAWPAALGWRATVAALGSDAPGPFTGGRFYGAEVDLELVWAALAWLDVATEVAVLTPGTFYRDERTMLRATVGLDARY